MIAQGRKPRGGVYEHQRQVDAQHGLQTVACQRQVRAAVEYEGGKRSHTELEAQKGHVSHLKQPCHQAVTLSSEIGAHPNERELCVQRIQTEEQKALIKGTHTRLCLLGCKLCLTLAPLKSETPKPNGLGVSSLYGRNETQHLTLYLKDILNS